MCHPGLCRHKSRETRPIKQSFWKRSNIGTLPFMVSKRMFTFAGKYSKRTFIS